MTGNHRVEARIAAAGSSALAPRPWTDVARDVATGAASLPAIGSPTGTTTDPRFRALLPPDAWVSLPAPVRRRFGERLAPLESAVYVGEVAWTRLNAFGWLYSQCARLVGAPLPLASGGRVPAAVVVTEDASAGGQSWTRLYARPGRAPQLIHSAKRFAGPTGLEECVGGGVGMRLTIAVEHRALVFRSRGFFVRALGREWALPRWLAPGIVEVVHREERDGRFSFTLRVDHPWFGRVVEQVAFFADARTDVRGQAPDDVRTDSLDGAPTDAPTDA
jgi:hypothetical protein